MTAAPTAAGSNPFNPRVVLALFLFGALVFAALLWMVGTGYDAPDEKNGGGHAGGIGINGYAALSRLLDKQGFETRMVRSEGDLKTPGLLVLTPPIGADADKLKRLIDERREVGPTMLVLPKWEAFPATMIDRKAKKGWVVSVGADSPDWADELGDYAVKLDLSDAKSVRLAWSGAGEAGTLPAPEAQSLSAPRIAPLVIGGGSGKILAGYFDDGGVYPALAHAAGNEVPDENSDEDEAERFPVVIVAEPDLLDNWGLADRDTAMLALELVRDANGGEVGPVAFDLTLNGLGAGQNLLTLAFRPPFLAATLCLAIAAIIAAWRAFRRFGPPLAGSRAIAFGKRALVANAAGLIRRSRRWHLLGAPYAALLRERLARGLALPRHADPAETEAAIDRALAARDPSAMPFSVIAARLRAARRPAELVRAGQSLQSLERNLLR